MEMNVLDSQTDTVLVFLILFDKITMYIALTVMQKNYYLAIIIGISATDYDSRSRTRMPEYYVLKL